MRVRKKIYFFSSTKKVLWLRLQPEDIDESILKIA